MLVYKQIHNFVTIFYLFTLVTCIALILPVWRTCGPRHKSISGPHLHIQHITCT